MTKKPHDAKLQGEAEKAPAVDSVRTKQELDAAEAKRQAKADLAAAHRAGGAAAPSRESHPKVHRSTDEGPVQDRSGEADVEDEP